MQKVALVTTIKRPPGDSLLQWLCYHLKVGFSHIYVYLDDPAEEASAAVVAAFGGDGAADPRVTLIRNDAEYLAHLKKHAAERYNFRKFEAFLESEVMGRQMVNI